MYREILYVGQDSDLFTLLRQALPEVQLAFATNGTKAQLRSKVFHAYIIDYALSDGQGSDVCWRLRKTDPAVPILFSGVSSDAERESALNAGATAFLQHPFHAPTLRHTLCLLLDLAELQSKQAHIETLRAIDDELRERAAEAMARTERAKSIALQAIEQAARLKGLARYMARGGSRAYFEAEWASSFSRACEYYESILQPTNSRQDPGGSK